MHAATLLTDFCMRPISRRSLLAATFLAAAATTSCAAGPLPPPLVEPGPGAVALNTRARHKGLFYGCALNDDTLTKDPATLARIEAECGIVVAEWSFKWAAIHPKIDKYDFTSADALMAWAGKQKIQVRGHALVWHEALPDWLPETLNAGNGEKLLTDHIHTVAGRYAKRLAHWDVVNEAINVEDKQPGGLRNTIWLRALGPAYLDIAFHATAVADPQALRVLNEYGTDYAIDWQERKRGALLDLLSNLTHRRVPIQAVGLQAHLDAAETALDQKILARFIADIASMGLKVLITEFDVRDDRLPADIASRDTAVADHGRAWLDAVLPNPAVLGVLSWGISDRHSWLNDKYPRADGLAQRPLPLDEDLNRKKLWSGIAASLDAAPARGTPSRT
jgi:endo-1,4-beta-xylanase